VYWVGNTSVEDPDSFTSRIIFPDRFPSVSDPDRIIRYRTQLSTKKLTGTENVTTNTCCLASGGPTHKKNQGSDLPKVPFQVPCLFETVRIRIRTKTKSRSVSLSKWSGPATKRRRYFTFLLLHTLQCNVHTDRAATALGTSLWSQRDATDTKQSEKKNQHCCQKYGIYHYVFLVLRKPFLPYLGVFIKITP
jgi:hypothetical protein